MDQFNSAHGSFDIGDGQTHLDSEIMDTGRVPVSVYTSQEQFDKERELFGRVWLNVARVEEIGSPGDWIVKEIPCRSVSVLITRGEDHQIRAFHNICRHRSIKLVWDTGGHGGTFVCPYHAWRYGLDGTLKAIPSECSFPHVDKRQSGLKPIAADVWEGFIFVNLDPNPARSLHEFMGPLAGRLRDAPFEAYRYTVTLREMLNANWKLALAAQSENYHIRALHRRTVSGMVTSSTNPFGQTLNRERLGAHSTYSSPRNPDFKASSDKPVQDFAFASSAFLIAPGGGENHALPSGFLDLGGINPARSSLWGADQFTVFPHVTINAGVNGWWMHRFWPVAPDKTWWEAIYYFCKPRSLREKFAFEYFLSFNRDTLTEDTAVIRMQQAAMASGAIPFIQFGDQEAACQHHAAVTAASTSKNLNLRHLTASCSTANAIT
jgi:phenylpropionate dioxygenase-like ring-hydroxylating dioxygenase large terminal subunit